MNVLETIRAGESETTEFKTSLAEWKDVIETISAFSNKNGGTIFIGVDLNGRQREALKSVFAKGFINNEYYRELNSVSDETARLELSQLVEMGLLKIKGKGRSTKYVLKDGE
ncbi:MAG: ATP-binding protein [Candidatus Methanoperedens sp.]